MMKIDWDLTRLMLRQIRATDIKQFPLYSIVVPGYEQRREEVHAHVVYLLDRRLLDGKADDIGSRRMGVKIDQLTAKGQDAAQLMGDEKLWERAKQEILADPDPSISFNLLLEWLENEKRKTLGLA